MIPIRQFDALLQTQSLNNKMFQTLVQGSEDTAIKAIIQQDGKNIQIDTGAEIELSEVIKLALDDAFSKTNEIKFVKADGEEVTNKILVYNVDDGKFKLEDNA